MATEVGAVSSLAMSWLTFGLNALLLAGLAAWLDARQTQRYNYFAQWTQGSVMPQLKDIADWLEVIANKEGSR